MPEYGERRDDRRGERREEVAATGRTIPVSWPAAADPVQVLQATRRVRGLQGHRDPAETADSSRQDIFPQTQRQLCRLSAQGQKRNQSARFMALLPFCA